MKRTGVMVTIFLLAMLFSLMPIYAMEYAHQLKADDVVFAWSVDADQIHIKLSGETDGWVGIGFDPEEDMLAANILIGAVKGGKVRIEDHWGDKKRGHSSDEKLGGKNDVIDPAGTEADGVTTIFFSYPLKTGDEFDKPIALDKMVKVILAKGAGRDSFRARHVYRVLYEINLSTGESKKIK